MGQGVSRYENRYPKLPDHIPVCGQCGADLLSRGTEKLCSRDGFYYVCPIRCDIVWSLRNAGQTCMWKHKETGKLATLDAYKEFYWKIEDEKKEINKKRQVEEEEKEEKSQKKLKEEES